MAKKREKKILEENYIQAKIASCKKLILDSTSPTQAAIYQGYLDFWVSKSDKDALEFIEGVEGIIELDKSGGPILPTIEEKVIEFPSVNVTATTETPIDWIDKSPMSPIKPITEVIEESQVETISEIKEAIDKDHAEIVNGNKIRCPECLGTYTKGAGFAAHYRAAHEEVISDKSIETDNS